MKEEQKREFTGVWIPAHIIQCSELSMVDKYIYAEINCFSECFLSNKTLSERAGCSEDTVSRSVKKLKELGFIEQTRFTGRLRYLRCLNDKPPQIHVEPPQNAVSATAKTSELPPPVAVLDNNEITDRKQLEIVDSPNLPTPQKIAIRFFSLSQQELTSYANKLAETNGANADIVLQELRKFTSYWSERNKTGTKMKWQLEKTFEVNRRLATWFNNVRDFKKSSGGKYTATEVF